MNRRKKDIIVLAVLLPVLFVILFSGWHKKGKRGSPLDMNEDTPGAVQETSLAGNPAEEKITEIIKGQIALENTYLEKGLPRNPFVQLTDEKKTKAKSITINVTGIFCGDENNGKSHVFIDGKILSKGDVFKGLTVEEIVAEHVILRKGDSTYKIKIGVPVTIPAD